jgi:RNA 3'-phosphate cyclase
MIHLDGSNGGGQILRTALALSIITQKPFTLDNIRLNRPQPGLREQHLQGLMAMVEICNGEASGTDLDSMKIVFHPGKIKNKNLQINIRTAGSIGLILQTLLPLALYQELDIKIKGGATHGKFAPPIEHFVNVILPILKENIEANLEIHHYGFFPKGGARVDFTSKPLKSTQIILEPSDQIKECKINSLAAKGLNKKNVCERQSDSAATLISAELNVDPIIYHKKVETTNLGSSIQITLVTAKGIFGGDRLGERGKKPEIIGESAAKQLSKEYLIASTDIHTSDMLIPFIGLVGGSVEVPRISTHIRNNILVCEKFIGKVFFQQNNKISSKGI